jgi:hypothetical protein
MNNNSVLAGAYYGSPVTGYRAAAIADAHIAPPSAPYLGRGDKCEGNDDTCGANKVRGQKFCAGHMKRLKSESVEVAE